MEEKGQTTSSSAKPAVDATAVLQQAQAFSGSRRQFLRAAGIAGVGMTAIGLIGCSSGGTKPAAGSAAGGAGTAADGGHQAAAPASSGPTEKPLTAEDIDRMHEAGVKAFPAKTEGKGAQPLAFRMEGDVKVFEITCKVVQWEVEPGKKFEAWTYNGTVPGPAIRVTEGDKIRVIVKNELPESTSVHWHGVPVPNSQDGVPFITQPPIKPGQTFTYEFTVPNHPGTHMYHTHHNATKQILLGLAGPFIVEPRDKSKEPKYDKEAIISLGDGPLGYTLNGKGFPATEPIVAKLGERVRVRFMNEGLQIHPMHIHGLNMLVFQRDGYPLPQPFRCDTLMIAPGERWDAIIECNLPGVWAFHCHVLNHAESEHGMFGMVTAIVVQK